MANGVAVLDDVLALGDVAKGELMTSGDPRQVLQGYGHRVNGIYLKELFHNLLVINQIQLTVIAFSLKMPLYWLS